MSMLKQKYVTEKKLYFVLPEHINEVNVVR